MNIVLENAVPGIDMRKPCYFVIACCLAVSGHLCSSDGAMLIGSDPSAIYQKANDAFEAGNYPEAIKRYETLVSENRCADALYLNLGTAHFRNGSPGRAALWFRRASHLNPGMPEVKQNFAFLRHQQGLLEFGAGDWEKILLGYSPDFLRWAGWILFWIALFSLLSISFGKRISIRPLLIVGLLFAGVGSSFFFWLNFYRANHLAPENFATVVVAETSALVAPAPDSAPVIALPEGSEVRIIEDTGPWLYASVPGDVVGWIHHSSVERNWPIPRSK